MSELTIGIMGLAVFLALLFTSRNYLLSFFGFCAVCLCLLTGGVAEGLTSLFADGLYGQILDPGKGAIVAFIALYCGYVGSMEYGGSIKGFTRFFSEKGAGTKRGLQVRAWIASVGPFFSDLGSPGIVGNMFFKKYDEAGLSRERLALLTNLTAVPVCSMIPLVGWGLFAVGIFNNTAEVAGFSERPITMFFESIPYFSFSLLAILTPLLLLSDRMVIGPLRQLEKEAASGEAYRKARARFEAPIDIAKEDGKGLTLILSLAVMALTLGGMLGYQGQSLLTAEVYPYMIALGVAFVTASLFAMVLTWVREGRPFMKSFQLYTRMFQRTLSVTGIMVVSWVFFDVAWKTGIYQSLSAWMGQYLPVWCLLPLIFLVSAALSSLTGSAWGTYAVMIPLGMVLCRETGLEIFAGIGAAVSGSVYGDISAKNSHAMHFSAESAAADPAVFRKVQMPYFYLMGMACVLAYGLGSLTGGWYACLTTAVVSYLLLLWLAARREAKKGEIK